jgi:type 1 glutamine amidotransferase
MKRYAIGFAVGVAIVCGKTLLAAAADDLRPLAVCLVSGSREYKSNESLAEFEKHAESTYNIRCSRAFIVGDDEEHLPGLDNLDRCDTMLLFTRRLKLSGDDLERIKKYCQSGRPIVGVRTASHAIQSWLDLDKEVLGGNYRGHYPEGPETLITILDSARAHPVLLGVQPYSSVASLYKNEGLPADDQILMTGTIPGHTEPITWVRTHKGVRIFYTSLGHPQDFAENSFRRMLVNALFWTAGRDPQGLR